MRGCTRKLYVRGDVAQLVQGMSLVGEGARRAGLAPRRRSALEAACREGYLAIAETFERSHRRALVEMEVAWDAEAISVTLHHSSGSLDTLFDRVPLDPRIVAMHEAVDEVRYVCGTRHGNQLSLIVHLPPPRPARRNSRRTPSRAHA
jgi:hypothetical protein